MYPSSYLYLGYRMRFTYVNSEQEHIGITNVVLRLRQIFPDAAFAFGNRPGAGAQITIDFPYVPFFRIDG